MKVRAESADAGKRLDAFLHEKLPEFSRARLQLWIRERRILLDGKAPRPSYLLRGWEEISIEPGSAPPLRAEPEELPLEILYEDEDVIAVDKRAGMVVHAGAGHVRGTLVNALLHRFGSLSSGNDALRPGIVHRLDRDTSGVLIVARTDRAHLALAKQFHDRVVEKVYLALTHGRMKQHEGRIQQPIARDPARRTRMTTRVASGRPALTEYRVLEELPQFSFLEVKPSTGRTHQIRVHLARVGHPIVGDPLYGAPRSIPEFPSLGRFFLHAHRLTFLSPSSGKKITVESALPKELVDFLEWLRASAARIK